jgi:hypothetical protein
MAKPAWYNDNQFRDFPFVTRVEPLAKTAGFASESSGQPILHLPHSAIVDFCAIMEIDAEYDEHDGHIIYLHAVSRFGDVFTFKFRTTAESAVNHEIAVSRELTDPEFLITRNTASTVLPEELVQFACPDQPRWTATVVTGSMRELAILLDDGETLYADPGLWQIEPARVQSLKKSYLRSVNLANAARHHTTPVAGCSLSSSYADDGPAIPAAYCLDGPLKFKEGFNCTIRQDNNNNAIIIGAGVGVGDGVPCEEIPLYEGELPRPGEQFLSGGPACNEVIKSINGVTGTDITILTGRGFQVQVDSDVLHKLVINRTLNEFAICNTDTPSSISVSGSESLDPTTCEGFTTADIFNVQVLAGLIATNSNNDVVQCLYNPVMSHNGQLTWTSPTMLVSYWHAGNFCGFRWRAKIICTPGGLHCSIVGYPLADNNPCMTCSVLLASPILTPVSVTASLDCRDNTNDCACVASLIATSITIEQQP